MTLESLSQEELANYLVENGDKFTVVGVRTDLVSVISGVNFEKCFVKSMQKLYEDGSIANLQKAALQFYGVGFDLEVHPASGIAATRGEVMVSVPLPIWARFYSEVVAPLFDGKVMWLMQHNETYEQITTTNDSKQLQEYRTSFGINPDLSLEEELLRVFEIS